MFQELILITQQDQPAVVKEALWALVNACGTAVSSQISKLVGFGVVKAFCTLLKHEITKVTAMALERLEYLLKSGYRSVKSDIQKCGGVKLLKALKVHSDSEIRERSKTLVLTYFDSEDTDMKKTPAKTSAHLVKLIV